MGAFQYSIVLIPIVLTLAGLEFYLSKRKRVQVYTLSDTIVNASCGVLERLFDFFWIVLMYFLFEYLYSEFSIWQFPSGFFTWIIALLVGDFLAYWHHRLSHTINFMWAAHIVHHQSEELNLSTVFRVSAFAVINRSLFWIWMPIAGFSPEVITSVIVFIGLYQFFTHTRLVGRLGFLEYILVTPSHHRVHHGRNDEYIDKNYGHVFIFWDKLFGTFTPEKEEPQYGIISRFASSDPIRAYFQYWGELFGKAMKADRTMDKIRIFFARPSWTPPMSAAAIPQEPPVNLNESARKYSNPTPLPVIYYVSASFILTISAFLWLLQVKKGMESVTYIQLFTDPVVVVTCLVIVLSIVGHGGLLDGKKWGFTVEFFRLALCQVCLIIIYSQIMTGIPLLLVIGMVVAVMAVFCFRLYRSNLLRK